MFDKNMFSQKLVALRKKRWTQYCCNQDKLVNPYEKFAYCKSQEKLAEVLKVERRTYGKWEAGTTLPTIDKAFDLCRALDCNIDYLLGTNELVGLSPSAIASQYSNISIDIIERARIDCEYNDFLRYFMHPDNCYALVKSVNNNLWKEYYSQIESHSLNDPLKSLITDIFHSYQAFTPLTQYKKESLREYIVSLCPESKFSYSSKKNDERICINTCMSKEKFIELGISNNNPESYNILINYLVDYCFNVFVTREILHIQKEKIGHMFVNMLEKFLEE